MVLSCDQCGICGDVCPKDIDVGSLILDARRTMVRQGDMPKAFSAFFLDDMAHANGPGAMIMTGAEPGGKCGYVFFPGCQLGASDPRYVSLTFERLKEMHPDMALLCACCGAPACWAGYEELHAEAVARIREAWRSLGEPVFVCACFTCMKMLAETLPEIQTISLYQMDWTVPSTGNGTEVSVFDPCASRGSPEAQQRVRALLTGAGYVLSPMKTEHAACCGWGGQYEIANPAMVRCVVDDRIHLSDAPFVTYCANCRDTFARAGKPASHILDILLGINDEHRASPTWTQRRKNRESLRRELLGETAGDTGDKPAFRLTISPELSRKLSERWMLEDDVKAAVRHSEETGEKLFDPNTGHTIGHCRLKNFTCWVVYKKAEDGFELVNAYSHRMQIMEGQQ
jgi:Fe-S oxidoreductase